MANLEAEQQAFIEMCQLPCKDCKWNKLEKEVESLSEDFVRIGKLIIDILTPIIEEGEEVLKILEDDGLVNTSLPLYSAPSPFCEKCGSTMVLDLATLNSAVWWCQTCYPPININDVKIVKSPKPKKKFTWLRDYFLRH